MIEATPVELKNCLNAGGHTTLMVWADCDHDYPDPESLKAAFWTEAKRQGISRGDFDCIVFIFAKDRVENWIEFLQTGKTDESTEGPRIRHNREAADAAKKLADLCRTRKPTALPPSLKWSCERWHALNESLKD